MITTEQNESNVPGNSALADLFAKIDPAKLPADTRAKFMSSLHSYVELRAKLLSNLTVDTLPVSLGVRRCLAG